jgi:hypothetical protein
VEYAPKVIRIIEATQSTLAGGLKQVKRVSFMVGDHGPFYEDFTPEQFTDAQVKARLQAVANTITAVC